MNKLLFFLLPIFFISCTTVKYVTIPLTQPPIFFYPNTNIQSSKDLINDYKNALIHIKKWQYWYDVQVNTNYFYSNKK